MQRGNKKVTRRRFLGQAACSGIGLSGLLSSMGSLRLMTANLSAQLPGGDDHKALVCLFLYGGNDGNNMVVPYDLDSYTDYQSARGILSLAREDLLPLTLNNTGGQEFALHPNMTLLRDTFNAGSAAVVANVGTLLAPLTKAEYESGGAAIPPNLFSHNDQQVQWQTSVPDAIQPVGWGGRLADLMQSLNDGSQISMNISLAGNNFFQIGNEVFQYQLTTAGSVGLQNYEAGWEPHPSMYQAVDNTLAMDYSHLFEAEYAKVFQRAVSNDTLLKATLAGIPEYEDLFPNAVDDSGNLTSLAGQLRMILRMIEARDALSMRRQVFFCALGGFDTHDDQLSDHATLMQVVSDAVHDFHQATVDLGIADQVTLFTSSDFNRTYSTNGKGSDHAWGSHQFVVGGAVQGNQLYGEMPIQQLSGPDDVGSRGSWIPGVAVDEYAATMAKWFGVSDADMPLVLPNIGRFSNADLGFML